MRYKTLGRLQKPNERVVCKIDHPPPEGTGVDLRDNVVGHVELTNTGKEVVARGNVAGEGRLTCSRCLKEFVWRFGIDFTEDCALREIDDPAEYETGGDEEDLIPILDDDAVDLTELIRQLIAVEAPFRPLCQPECRGLCPRCGAELGTEECSCAKTDIDPRWAKLKDLLEE